MQKLNSRKLAVWIGTIAALAGVAVTEQQLALYAVICGTVVSVGYMIAQAYVDAKGAENTNVDEVLEAIESVLAKVEGSDDAQS